MKSKRIYIDFDDVLCETALCLMRMFNLRHGKSLSFDQIDTFDLSKAFGLTHEQTEELIEAFHDPEVLASLVPIDDACLYVRSWVDAGACIDIVTGRPPLTDAASRAWLSRHHVPYERLFFVDKYGRGHEELPGVESRTCEQLRDHGYALAIDDSATMATFLATRTEIPVLLFTRPWNAEFDTAAPEFNGRITRCDAWSEIDARVRALIRHGLRAS